MPVRPVVLLTGAGGAASEAIMRLWHDRYDVIFADCDPEAFPLPIPRERRCVIPRADAAEFEAEVARVCASRGVTHLVPGVDEELPRMAGLQAAATDIAILVPPHDFVLAMLDKAETAGRLDAAGLDAPRTRLADDPGDLAWPLVIKPRSGRGSRGVMVLSGPDQVDPYLRLHGLRPDQVVLQERLVGTEFTVYVSSDAGGRLRAVLPVRVEQKRGITIRAVVDMDASVIAYCEAIHAALGPRGPYNVQLIRTPAGRVAAFEVNPRVSTTLCLAIAAGADPVAEWHGLGEWPRQFDLMYLRRNWYNHLGPVREG